MQFKSHKMGIKKKCSQPIIFYQLEKQNKTKQKRIDNTTIPLITTDIFSTMFSLILLAYL